MQCQEYQHLDEATLGKADLKQMEAPKNALSLTRPFASDGLNVVIWFSKLVLLFFPFKASRYHEQRSYLIR